MDRDYDISSIWKTTLNQNDIFEILRKYNISLYDKLGDFRSTSNILSDINHKMSVSGTITASRELGDAMMSLSYGVNVIGTEIEDMRPTICYTMAFDHTRREISEELDSFLGGFKIKNEGVR